MNKRKRLILRWLKRNAGWHYESMIASGAKVELKHLFEHLSYLHERGLIDAREEPEPRQAKSTEPRWQYRLKE